MRDFSDPVTRLQPDTRAREPIVRDTLPQIAPHLRVGWRWPDALGAMRYPAFRWFFFGQLISLLGSWMQTTAVQWLAYRLTGSVLSLGAITFASFVPVLFLSLFMGVVVDRYSRRRLLLLTQSTFMVLAAILAYLTYSGAVTYNLLLVLSLLLGVANALDMPARQAFFSDLVDRDDLLNAIALNSSVFNGTRILGPALGGLVVAVWGEAMAFGLNALSFLAVLVALVAMRLPPSPLPARRGASGGGRELREGLNHLRGDRPVLGLVVMIAAFSLIGFPASVLLPALAEGVLGLGVKGYGALMAAMGIGALVAGVMLAIRGRSAPSPRQLLLQRLLFAASLILLGVARTLPVVGLSLVAMGYALIAQLTVTNTLVQLLAPDALRGRLVSAYTWALGGFWPLGALLLGAVGQRLGVPETFWLAGVACGLVSLVGWRVFPAAAPPVDFA
jgi:MFS family permease